MNNRLLYPTTRFTINPNRYKIIENHSDWINNDRYTDLDCGDDNVLDDIYAEDERKNILYFVWNKPGYLRAQRPINRYNYYQESYEVNNDDIKTDNDLLYDTVDELEELVIETPSSSLVNSVVIDSNTPSICLSDIQSDEEELLNTSHELNTIDDLIEEELDISALADTFDELAISEVVDEEDEINIELLEHY